jgi:hypothetical protein
MREAFNMFFTGAGNGTNCFELYDKKRLQCEIELIKISLNEMVHSAGTKINYWINNATLSSIDGLYGEDTTALYTGPFTIKMRIELNESALALSKFGFNADDEVTAYITYDLYTQAFSANPYYILNHLDIEPKSGDVFEMVEYGLDRKGGRSGNYFIITERRDQDISAELNPLGGHYGWRMKAKRMEYSWQPNLPQESANNQVTDDTEYGLLSPQYTTIYWYTSSSNNSWFNINNWFIDSNRLSAYNKIPNHLNNIVLLGNNGPLVDLDNYNWIQPNSVSGLNATLKLSSNFERVFSLDSSNVTIELLGNSKHMVYPKSETKIYTDNSDDFGKEIIIDMSLNHTEVYGTYDFDN